MDFDGDVFDAMEIIRGEFGLIPGLTVSKCQVKNGKLYFYGPGEESGQGGDEVYTCTSPFSLEHTPGELCGPHLSGSGDIECDTIEQCLQYAIIECGHIPGIDIHKCQVKNGKGYFYGRGGKSGHGGDEVYTCNSVNYEHTPNAFCGPHLPGSGDLEHGDCDMEEAMCMIKEAGYDFVFGMDLSKIQLDPRDGKIYFYGPGDSSGQGSEYVYTMTNSWRLEHDPGSLCGFHLEGSGDKEDTGLEDGIAFAMRKGHIPGITLDAIQLRDGLTYFYGPGGKSGHGADGVYRVTFD
jgi:hypothetical protein